MPHIGAGWIASGAADPAVGRKDHGRNFCADGIWDIAAAKTVAAADGIPRAAAIAIAIARAVIVNPAVETESAVTVNDKEITGAMNPSVEAMVTNAVVARAAL